VAYPGFFFGGGGVQQIQLKKEGRENRDLGAVALEMIQGILQLWHSTQSEKKKGQPPKGRFTLYVMFPFRHCPIFVLSDWSVFTQSIMFSHVPEQHMIGDLRLFPLNMRPHSFSKRQLAATALMLYEGEKNAALSNKKHLLQNCKRNYTAAASCQDTNQQSLWHRCISH
jgi:hypothetical protein